MSLRRQGGHYLWIGGLQWLVDWGVMVALSHFGLRIGVANVAGRVTGALIGFWLNGRITFGRDGQTPGRAQFARFLVVWLALTALSTVLIELIDDDLGRRWAWLAKPLVEIGCGALGFLASRYWIYRR